MRSAPAFLIALAVAAGACGTDPKPTPTEQPAKKEPAPVESDSGGADAGATAPDRPAERDEPPTAERVLLIVIDTLRADRLGCYGYEDQPTTPTLDRLAGEGIAFERFHAASPWTGASFGSILTGVSPTVHGAGRREKEGSKNAKSILGVTITPMSDRVPTVAEVLEDLNTAAIVTNSFLIESMGFARGFDHYDQQFAGLVKSRRADETTRAAIEWLEKNHQQPFFLMVHYFDPHMSYNPPKEYLERFAPGAGRVSGPFYDHRRARAGKLDLKEDEKEQIRRVYNGEVRFVDDQVGELVKAMKRLGVLDDTWLMITADHGEEQFDHGSFDHGHRYEEEVVRVPLIIRPPDGEWKAGARIPYSARHIDLAPTILDWLGRDPAPSMAGQSLMGLITGEETEHRPAYMEFNIYWLSRCALFDGRYKLIRATESDNGWLYDLDDDPIEQEKLDRSHPRYAVLETQLEAVRKQLEQQAIGTQQGVEEIELPREVIESLRSLGYLD